LRSSNCFWSSSRFLVRSSRHLTFVCNETKDQKIHYIYKNQNHGVTDYGQEGETCRE
jgi:hypothetical protein